MRKLILSINQRKQLSLNNITVKRKWWKKLRCGDKPIEIEPYCNFERSSTVWEMGAFSYSHSALPVDATVGRYCSIASDLWVMEHQHPTDRFTTSPISYERNVFGLDGQLNSVDMQSTGPITIKNDVWIGRFVTLKPGITIGNGAIIAANSVVTKDVPDYAIVGGVPAKVIRFRFEPSIIDELLKLEWWKYSCLEFADLKMDTNILDFIEQIKTRVRNSELELFQPNPVVI
ncbi:CatB-related O-acetyltransferase [Vibrio viridaestus]|uniref:Antibiotic acetyltransferase n=1 Tax=Vibrio viridaestus TaxID=2487322 RepID=A0A3N9TCD5_9VIBR|nr:CatB-related O-acetyltransferase [Vibrio viridaestus]RQW61690.1 antibiotic acetyltransferase [Vibrio viridaestus]